MVEVPLTVLSSYVQGRWTTPDGDGAPVRDAVTGDEIARLSTAGIDMAAVLDYGRRVGGRRSEGRGHLYYAHPASQPHGTARDYCAMGW